LATIDFSKAFDSIWHSALFRTLLAIGLLLCVVSWTRPFLSDKRARSFSVALETAHKQEFYCH